MPYNSEKEKEMLFFRAKKLFFNKEVTLEKGKFWIKKSKVIDLEKSSRFLEIFFPSKQVNLPYNGQKEKIVKIRGKSFFFKEVTLKRVNFL